MPWQALVLIRILVSNILHPIFFKKIADKPYKIKRQFFVYSFCFLLSLIYFLVNNEFNIPLSFTLIVAIGLANSLAFNFHLKAVDISQSRSSVLSVFTDFIAIILAFIFLNEYEYLNINLALGLFLIILSSAIFLYNSKSEFKKTRIFFRYILGYSIIWGIIAIFEKVFAFGGIPFATFGLGWYFGSWLGTSVHLLIGTSIQEKNYRLSGRELASTFNVGFFIWLSMLVGYFVLKSIPLSVYEPFLIISQIIFPTLIGLFIFKEVKSVKKLDIAAFILAIISGLIIAFNY